MTPVTSVYLMYRLQQTGREVSSQHGVPLLHTLRRVNDSDDDDDGNCCNNLAGVYPVLECHQLSPVTTHWLHAVHTTHPPARSSVN